LTFSIAAHGTILQISMHPSGWLSGLMTYIPVIGLQSRSFPPERNIFKTPLYFEHLFLQWRIQRGALGARAPPAVPKIGTLQMSQKVLNCNKTVTNSPTEMADHFLES
jgi:hypothetical protein